MANYLRPIKLQVNPGAWAYYAKRNADPRFKSYFKTVEHTCDHTCQFCGFKDKAYMQVVNIDGNYKNNKLSNLVLACPLCAQCFFIEMIGKVADTGATLIYYPSMSQESLNALCHALFCAIYNGTKYADAAQALYNELKLKSKPLEDNLGKGLSNPAFMGQMIIDTPVENKQALSDKLLQGVRVLPNINQFKRCVQAWSKTALKGISN